MGTRFLPVDLRTRESGRCSGPAGDSKSGSAHGEFEDYFQGGLETNPVGTAPVGSTGRGCALAGESLVYVTAAELVARVSSASTPNGSRTTFAYACDVDVAPGHSS